MKHIKKDKVFGTSIMIYDIKNHFKTGSKMSKHIVNALLGILGIVCSCRPLNVNEVGKIPPIQPDYVGVTIPANIAPLCFCLVPDAEYSSPRAHFESNGISFFIRQRHGTFRISRSKWRRLTEEAAGSEIKVTIQAKFNGKWIEFLPFRIYVSSDEINPFIVYRLIEPGYEIWNEMGIYQRCLENFEERIIIDNAQIGHGCVNCHSFNDFNQKKMLFHARSGYDGTYLIQNREIEKLNTKTSKTISSLVYPQWQKEGRYIAFSVNDTKQMFHSSDANRVEVFDYKSDVVVYDVRNKVIFSCPQLEAEEKFENYPTFSPDGKSLFFCSADSLPIPECFDKIRYSLCRIGFDSETPSFTESVDTVINSRVVQKSVSFPRVSPDGKFLMYTMSAYGNFSIWHNDADLYLYNLQTGRDCRIDGLNSDCAESYHSWSRNSRWVVFSSRRMDGLYTRLYFAHIDENGNTTKPFVLPQRSPSFYYSFLKSYNVPEFIDGEVVLDPRDLHKVAKDSLGTNLIYKE